MYSPVWVHTKHMAVGTTAWVLDSPAKLAPNFLCSLAPTAFVLVHRPSPDKWTPTGLTRNLSGVNPSLRFSVFRLAWNSGPEWKRLLWYTILTASCIGCTMYITRYLKRKFPSRFRVALLTECLSMLCRSASGLPKYPPLRICARYQSVQGGLMDHPHILRWITIKLEAAHCNWYHSSFKLLAPTTHRLILPIQASLVTLISVVSNYSLRDILSEILYPPLRSCNTVPAP